MKNTKLITLLSSFSPQEISDLKVFVETPSNNKHKGVICLLHILEKAYPTFDPEVCSRENLFHQVFETESFDYQKISDLFTYLLRLAEQFLAKLEFESDTFTQNLFLLRQMRSRNLKQPFQRKLTAIKASIPQLPDASDYHHLFLLEAESVGFHIQQKVRSTDESFLRMTANLDYYYAISRLRLGCGMLNRKDVQATDFDLSMVTLLADYLETQHSQLSQSPLVQIYLNVFRMMENKKETILFDRTYTFVSEHMHLLPQHVLRETYAYLMNYCIHRINQGDHSFQETLFALYQWQLETSIIFEDNFLSPWDYKNITSLGLKLKKFEWVESFVHQYQTHLPEQFRKQAFIYNSAILHFEKKEYLSSLRLLREVEFDDIYYQIGAKTMLLKIYFETNDLETFFYHSDAFEAYLKRQKQISAYQKEIYLNFITFARKLARLTGRAYASYQLVKPIQIHTLRKKILQKKNVAQSTWLIYHTDKLFSFPKNY